MFILIKAIFLTKFDNISFVPFCTITLQSSNGRGPMYIKTLIKVRKFYKIRLDRKKAGYTRLISFTDVLNSVKCTSNPNISVYFVYQDESSSSLAATRSPDSRCFFILLIINLYDKIFTVQYSYLSLPYT